MKVSNNVMKNTSKLVQNSHKQKTTYSGAESKLFWLYSLIIYKIPLIIKIDEEQLFTVECHSKRSEQKIGRWHYK